jgi:hypothetical protein
MFERPNKREVYDILNIFILLFLFQRNGEDTRTSGPTRTQDSRSSNSWNMSETMGHSSGYHTDAEYHLYEDEHCLGPGYRNPRSVVEAKNENAGKCKNVDAYFVDTLNKSMDECKTGQTTSKSVEHLYAEVKPKTRRDVEDTTRVRSPNAPRRNSLGSKNVISGPFRANQHADDSSSDSCGSSFIPAGAKLSEKQRSTPQELDVTAARNRPARSSSTCSMPAEVARLRFSRVNNSESMPNIVNSSGADLLSASQLNSSSSVSESDNMSEQSGYVSTRKSSIGSTAPVSPTSRNEAQRFVRGDVLKEKLERLVKLSKTHCRKKGESDPICPSKDYVNIFELRASTLPMRRSKQKEKSEYEVPFSLKNLEPITAKLNVSPAKLIKNDVRRSESLPSYSLRYIATRTGQRGQQAPNVEEAEQPSEDENADKSDGEKHVESENDSWFEAKMIAPGEMSRYDPKRMSRRFIQRRPKAANAMLAVENGHDLPPPTQFQDAPPPLPPEAFRDPPQPIDNLLYYVVESVHENREMNRREVVDNRMEEYSRK